METSETSIPGYVCVCGDVVRMIKYLALCKRLMYVGCMYVTSDKKNLAELLVSCVSTGGNYCSKMTSESAQLTFDLNV